MCKKGEAQDDDDDDGSEYESVEVEIDAEEGGKVESADGNLVLSIPADALEDNQSIGIKKLRADDLPESSTLR